AREVLMQPPDGNSVDLNVARRSRPLVTPAGDPRVLEQLADWLSEAEAPLAVVGNLGRHPEAVQPLVELAERIGMPIADTHGPLNVPFDHPLFVDDASAAIRDADVLLLLDVDVPWIPRQVSPAANARIAQIDIDPLKATIGLWGFPVDLPIQADTSKALPALLGAVEECATADRRNMWTQRREQYAAAHVRHQQARAAQLVDLRASRPIAAEGVG